MAKTCESAWIRCLIELLIQSTCMFMYIRVHVYVHVHVHLYKANFGHLCKHAAKSPTQLRSLVAKHHPAAPPARFQLCGAAVAQYFSSQNSISTTLQQPSLLMTSRKQAFLLKLSIWSIVNTILINQLLHYVLRTPHNNAPIEWRQLRALVRRFTKSVQIFAFIPNTRTRNAGVLSVFVAAGINFWKLYHTT